MTFLSTDAVTLHGATEIRLGPISFPASPFQNDKLRILWVSSQIDGQYNNIESHSLLFSAGSHLLSSSFHVVGYNINKSTFVIYALRAHSSSQA